MNELKIETVATDRYYTTLCITGFTVEEMNLILNVGHNKLRDAMQNHGMVDTYDYWRDGFGIYSIRHCGGMLFVQVGNNCD